MVSDEAALVALAGLPGLGPRRLTALLGVFRPTEAWDIVSGHRRPPASLDRVAPAAVWERWARAAAACSPDRLLADCRSLGIGVAAPGSIGYPDRLRTDPAPPAVVFWRGDPQTISRPCVAVIGTRHPTRSGLDTAFALGRDLTALGVVVVSGLARGIDGAAHRGVLEAGGRPVGVVANGLERAYPAIHRRLWAEVAASGVLISEWPPGTTPDAFRFPLRNRMIAGLADIVVVVESRERGGSMSTVAEALDRGVEVMAVPGSVHVPASAGTNGLIRDGAAPVTRVDDIALALGLSSARIHAVADRRPAPDDVGRSVIRACAERPRTLDDLVTILGAGLAETALALARLERDGWLIETGGWFQVVGSWAGVGSVVDAASTSPRDPTAT